VASGGVGKGGDVPEKLLLLQVRRSRKAPLVVDDLALRDFVVQKGPDLRLLQEVEGLIFEGHGTIFQRSSGGFSGCGYG